MQQAQRQIRCKLWEEIEALHDSDKAHLLFSFPLAPKPSQVYITIEECKKSPFKSKTTLWSSSQQHVQYYDNSAKL